MSDILDTTDAGPAAIRGSALRTIGFVTSMLLSLASAPLLFRHLGVTEFGRYTTVLSVVTLAAGFSEGGLNAVALREYASTTGARRDRLMASLLGLRIVLTVAAAGLGVVFALAAGYDEPLVVGVVLGGAGLVGQTTQTLLLTSLQADLRFGWATAVELLRQVTLVGLLVALVLAGAGLVPLVGAQIPASLAALALTAALVRGHMPLRPRLERELWLPLLRDTLPYAVAIAVNIAYFRIAMIVTSLVAGEVETGYFATSYRIVEVLIALPPVILAAAFPILVRAARDDETRFTYAAQRLYEVALIAGALGALALALGAGFAVEVLGGDEAEPAAPVLRLQAPAIVATFVAVACSYPLLSLRAHREVLLANLAALTVCVLLLAALVAPYGAEGAAVATLGAEFTLAAATAWYLRRRQPGIRLLTRAALAALAAAAAAVAAALALDVDDLVRALVGIAVFAVAITALGQAPREILDAVRRR